MPKKPRGVVQRFWERVEKHDGCWRWSGPVTDRGYGRVHVSARTSGTNAKITSAHRLSWELHYGPVPTGLQVCHSCDNKLCVNPAHLFLGTHSDNMADRNAKGRQARGSRHGLSKLSEVEVQRIRNEVAAGKSFNQIARETGYSETTVSRAARGLTWRHVSNG